MSKKIPKNQIHLYTRGGSTQNFQKNVQKIQKKINPSVHLRAINPKMSKKCSKKCPKICKKNQIHLYTRGQSTPKFSKSDPKSTKKSIFTLVGDQPQNFQKNFKKCPKKYKKKNPSVH